jgi:RNA polymerase sigma-70 factor (ECF subfamily)
VHEGLAEHVPHVYRLALRLSGDRHRAEDLTQETFLRAWSRRQQLKDSRAERVWLFRIAANIWRDELRKRRSPAAKMFSLPDEATGSEPTPDHQADARESLAHALELLDGLPVRQRTVLYLIAIEGLSSSEVGNILGINANAVKVNLSLARKRMREQMAKKDPASGSRSKTATCDE